MLSLGWNIEVKKEYMYGDLVSVIMPAYNCEAFIGDAIKSVITQTYSNVELLIVDDCSTDATVDIVLGFSKSNENIKYFKLERNSGAAFARNYAIKKAEGVYLAFLDSDDIWLPNKLDLQIKFMEENNFFFTCTDFGKIDEFGKSKNIRIPCLLTYDYYAILKDCPGNSTVIYNAKVLGKFYVSNIKRRNDFVMWLKVIKAAKFAYGLNILLSYHRERVGSISINKKGLLKYQWIVYREIEKLPFYQCCFLMLYKIAHTISYKLRGLNSR